MGGTRSIGPVRCPTCGRTVQGFRSRVAYKGDAADWRTFAYKHRDPAGVDCEGRFVAVSTPTEGATR